MTAIKIGFVLLSNSRNPIPSTRIAALNMFPFLREADFDPHIVYEPEQGAEVPDVSGITERLVFEGFHVVVFQKVHGPSVEGLARKLSTAGIRTVYAVCDLVDNGMAAATDATVVVTDYLKSLYARELQQKIHTVHDGIERPDVSKTSWGKHQGTRTRPLHAVLVTSAGLDRLPVLGSVPDWLRITIVGRYAPTGDMFRRLHEIRWKFAGKRDMNERLAYIRFLVDRRIRCVPWDSQGVYEVMRQADIGIVPIEQRPEHVPRMPAPAWKVKSENRLTMKMGIGLPVIATPIPAYEPVIEHGVNGFFARSKQDWITILESLRDPVIRRSVGERARASVIKRYSMQEQARRLIAVLHGLQSGSI